jgi:hypothetical protein
MSCCHGAILRRCPPPFPPPLPGSFALSQRLPSDSQWSPTPVTGRMMICCETHLSTGGVASSPLRPAAWPHDRPAGGMLSLVAVPRTLVHLLLPPSCACAVACRWGALRSAVALATELTSRKQVRRHIEARWTQQHRAGAREARPRRLNVAAAGGEARRVGVVGGAPLAAAAHSARRRSERTAAAHGTAGHWCPCPAVLACVRG